MIRKIDYIVIHCSATSRSAKVEAIQNYWRNTLKWNAPGYHVLIEENGTRHYLQPFDKLANGVRGFNQNSIHISYIGGVDASGKAIDNRTEAQKASILIAIKEAMEYAVKGGTKPVIQGHRDFEGVTKACPSFNCKREYQWITK
jgi:N-acetylmuramoyl-L-alanine amidase